MEIKCPKCGSDKVAQYRQPTGPIWCDACGHRVEKKELDHSFYIMGKVRIHRLYTEVDNDIFHRMLHRAKMEGIFVDANDRVDINGLLNCLVDHFGTGKYKVIMDKK